MSERILLKLSGEALKGDQQYGIDVPYVQELGKKIVALQARGYEIAIVLGAGNIFRGSTGEKLGLERATGDYMGMLATIINGMALGSSIEQAGGKARIMSSIDVPKVAELFIHKRALKHLERGRIIVCVGGTGNPFYTTDSAAVLRALELQCAYLVKGTKVDGIYDKDPEKNTDAKKYERLSLDDAIQQNIRVMDQSAIALARDEQLPMYVCHIDQIDLIGTEKSVGTEVYV